jgi:molybdate transport system substrate-binding protein
MLIRFAALLAALLTLAPAGPAAVLTVSAAISLTDALEEAGSLYRSASGDEVRFNFGGSNVLARQIVNGAPVDVFISADEAQMKVVEAAGGVLAGSRVDLLGNTLAVVVAQSGTSIKDAEGLAGAGVKRIALGAPEAVPAGVYARQYLPAAGIWERVAPRVVPVANVRAALTAVETATVDAAIVYESDVRAASRSRLAFLIQGAHSPRIVYPAAVLARSANRDAAARFLTFLRGAQASAIFKRFHFIPIAGQR